MQIDQIWSFIDIIPNESDFVDAILVGSASNGYIHPALKNMRKNDKKVDIKVPHWEKSMEKWKKPKQRDKKCPTSEWLFNRFRSHSMNDLFEKGGDIMDASVRWMQKTGVLPKSASFGLDAHHIPCHAVMDDEKLKRGKPKNGTSKMESYFTMSTVDGPAITTSIFPHTTDDPVDEIVSAMIHNTRRLGIGIDNLYLDREFYSIGVLRVLHRSNISYIMAVPKTKPIKKHIEAFHNGTGDAIVRHTVHNSKESEEVTLLIHKREDADKQKEVVDMYIVLAFIGEYETADEIIANIPEYYRKRWGIETAYRNIENMRARTRSMAPGVRWFLFMFTAALSNFWAMVNWFVLQNVAKVVAPAITISTFRDCLYAKISEVMAIMYKQRAGLGPPLPT